VNQFAGALASLPSPSSGTLDIGPIHIHAYGLMIALGVVAGVWLMGRRFELRHIGTRDDANSIAMWGVLGGIIGARLYHVATDWSKFAHHLADIPKIWQGGLGIPGGLLLGTFAGIWAMRQRNIPVAVALDCAAPALPLAQSIGRWGNWWNQELFGRPTTLPWALRVGDAQAAAAGYPHTAGTPLITFHPTFLYESLANVLLCLTLLVIDRRFKVRTGHLLAYYLMGYGAIRFFVEGLRIDEAHHIAGLRLNQWVALAAIVGAGVYIAVSSRREPQMAIIDDHFDDDDLDDDIDDDLDDDIDDDAVQSADVHAFDDDAYDD
jgi:prolipoprotein diacylglyceryl transferase